MGIELSVTKYLHFGTDCMINKKINLKITDEDYDQVTTREILKFYQLPAFFWFSSKFNLFLLLV